MGDDFGINTFAYLEEMDLIAVLVGKKVEKRVVREIRFYDRTDLSYERGHIPWLKEPFRQFLPTQDGRLFLNLWNKRYEKEDGPILVEVELFSHPKGIELRRMGETFHNQRKAFEKWNYAFKLRWLVADGSDLLVINHLQPVLKRYGKDDDKQYQSTDQRYLALPKWISPYLPKDLESDKWRHSFSKNTGLERLGNGFLYVFEGPNPEHSFYADTEGKADAALHVLYLQRVTVSGKLLKDPLIIPGGYFAGTRNDVALVVVKDKNSTEDSMYRLHRVDL